MKLVKFKNIDFVIRKEVEEFKDLFLSPPVSMLFVYGPPSCGKTSLLERAKWEIEKSKYRRKVKFYWFNLRDRFLSDYSDILKFLAKEKKSSISKIAKAGQTVKKFIVPVGPMKYLSMGVEFGEEFYNRILRANLDIVQSLKFEINKYSKKGKKIVIVIDELQTLKEIYLSNDKKQQRLVLNELLNFFLRISKVEHKATVLCVSSNPFILEEIENDIGIEGGIDYKVIDYLSKEELKIWLENYNFSEKDIEFIWSHTGGTEWVIHKIIKSKKKNLDWKEVIESERERIKSLIIRRIGSLSGDIKQKATEFLKEILQKTDVAITLSNYDYNLLKTLVEKELIYYDLIKSKVSILNKITEEALKEILL